MAEAKKCDACGAFYEKDILNMRIEIVITSSGFHEHYIDLCPKCFEQVRRMCGLDKQEATE